MALKVPASLIRHVCYQTTYRLPKLDHLVVDRLPEPKVELVHTTSYTRIYPASANRLAIRRGEVKGNLKKDDYRFFIGVNGTSPIATCRWCGVVTTNDAMRKGHGKSTCKVMLVQLYAPMLKDRHCAVCNAFTGGSCWGVPLCQEGCQNEWMLNISPTFRMLRDKLKIKEKEILTP